MRRRSGIGYIVGYPPESGAQPSGSTTFTTIHNDCERDGLRKAGWKATGKKKPVMGDGRNLKSGEGYKTLLSKFVEERGYG